MKPADLAAPAVWALGLGAAGLGTYFVWKNYFQRTEGPPSSVEQPPAVEGNVGQGYVRGVPVTVQLEDVGGGKFLRVDAARAFKAMQAAAREAGLTLSVVSGFRTNAEQIRLYNGWVAKQPGFNLAAKPGYSNHQGGISTDLNTTMKGDPLYVWLKANAARFGFKNDVPSEHWHWTFEGTSSLSGVRGSGLGDPMAMSANPVWHQAHNGTLILLVGVGAMLVYQLYIRTDEGPREIRRGAVEVDERIK